MKKYTVESVLKAYAKISADSPSECQIRKTKLLLEKGPQVYLHEMSGYTEEKIDFLKRHSDENILRCGAPTKRKKGCRHIVYYFTDIKGLFYHVSDPFSWPHLVSEKKKEVDLFYAYLTKGTLPEKLMRCPTHG